MLQACFLPRKPDFLYKTSSPIQLTWSSFSITLKQFCVGLGPLSPSKPSTSIGTVAVLPPRDVMIVATPSSNAGRNRWQKIPSLRTPPNADEKRPVPTFPMSEIRCIGIATGGGDAPGLNAVIRAATKAAILKYGWKVIGIPDGFDGLIWPEKSFELTLKEISGILPRGGTILGTTNRGNPFHFKMVEDGKEITRDISDQVIANSRKLGIDATVTIGGDGSQKIGHEVFQKGMKIVGVAKTIDNDLSATEVK